MEKMKLQADYARMLLKVAEDIRSLAEILQTSNTVTKESPPEAKTDDPPITLEKVRGILAIRSRSGHAEEVRAILMKYGADRLSAIDPKDYAAVLKDAEVL